MNKDMIWQLVRAALNASGAASTVYFYMTEAQLEALVSALFAIASIAWGFYVRYNTKAVPTPTVNRLDLPTVSSATGAREAPPSQQP